jgi:hypothetical protein
MASVIQIFGRHGIQHAALSTTASSLLAKTSEIAARRHTLQHLCLTRAAGLSAFRIRNFSSAVQEDAAVETVPVTYIYPDGEKVEANAEIGKHLLDVAHDNGVDLEGGKSHRHSRLPFESRRESCSPLAVHREEYCIYLLQGSNYLTACPF